jgi:hypothetical protein
MTHVGYNRLARVSSRTESNHKHEATTSTCQRFINSSSSWQQQPTATTRHDGLDGDGDGWDDTSSNVRDEKRPSQTVMGIGNGTAKDGFSDAVVV